MADRKVRRLNAQEIIAAMDALWETLHPTEQKSWKAKAEAEGRANCRHSTITDAAAYMALEYYEPFVRDWR